MFVIGSLLDILDGALARAGGKATPFGAFVDSTTDRMGEAAMLGAIGLVFMRARHTSSRSARRSGRSPARSSSRYTRARAEALGLRGDVGLSSRAERVVIVITPGSCSRPGACCRGRSTFSPRAPG